MGFVLLILVVFITIVAFVYVFYHLFRMRHIIKRWINRKRAYLYKKRKIKQSIIEESEHLVRFNVVLKDFGGNHKFSEEFDIVIPARATFFARKKLEAWLKDNITFEIIDIKLKENND